MLYWWVIYKTCEKVSLNIIYKKVISVAKTKSRGNGEGTIYYIESKKLWSCQYVIGTTPEGKLKRKTLYGKTRKECKKKLDDLIHELKGNTYSEKSIVSINEIASKLIEDQYAHNHLSDTSYKRKLETLKQLNGHYIGKIPIQKITKNDIKDFYSYIVKYSNSVISKNYNLLNKSLSIAVKERIIPYNFLQDDDDLQKPKSCKPTKKVVAFTVSEQKQLFDALLKDTSIYRTPLLLSLYTGIRMGEADALYLDDIDFNEKTINIARTVTRDKNDKSIIGEKTKTYAGQRIIIMNPFVESLLKEYIENNNPDGLLFKSKTGGIISTSQSNDFFKRFCKRNNIESHITKEINQHMLRHTFATRCIESGMPANVLQKILGHTDIKTTLNTYCDVFAEFERKRLDASYDYLKSLNLI